MGGLYALPFVLEPKVITLDSEEHEIRERPLTLFAGRAKRAIGLEGELNIRITSDAEMRRLNRQFRKKNQATDVLSFPSGLADMAGDVAISADIAAANATQLGHSLDTELKILILHGLLHLAGYDHESDEGQMSLREARLRRQFRLPVGLIERTTTLASRRGRRR